MKKISTFILSILLILSGLAYINISILETAMPEIISSAGGGEIIETMNQFTALEPILEYVPVEYQKEVERVIHKATQNKKIDSIITEQSSVILDDILNETNSFDQSALTQEVMEVFDHVAEEIEEATEHTIPKEQIKTQFEQRIVGYNLTTYYAKIIQKVQNKLTPKQKEYLNFMKFFVDNVKTFKIVSLITLAISNVVLALISLKSFITAAVIGLTLTLINKILLPILLSKITYRAIGQSLSLIVDEKTFTVAWSYLGGLFVLGVLGKLFGKRIQE